jgi:hypothetical protein
MESIVIAKGQTFEGEMVSIDGSTFRDCQFIKCVLYFSGLLPVDLRGSSFTECQWEFVGPAANTMGFLGALYRRGETRLVESVFDNVRGNSQDPHEDHRH